MPTTSRAVIATSAKVLHCEQNISCDASMSEVAEITYRPTCDNPRVGLWRKAVRLTRRVVAGKALCKAASDRKKLGQAHTRLLSHQTDVEIRNIAKLRLLSKAC